MFDKFYFKLRLLFITALPGLLTGQHFIKNTSGKPLTFKEIQLKYHLYKSSTDLKNSVYWKHFKRYEAEMQLHTNGQGEPAGFEDYINEAIKVAKEKESSSLPAPWSPVGPLTVPNNLTNYMENGIGRVNCVAFNPTNSAIYYVGVAQGGLWKTTNGGASYTPLTDNLPITRVSDICIDPNNHNTMYISLCDFAYIGKGLYLDGRKRHTHFGLGVYKTIDGGTSWQPTGLTFQLTNGDASLIKKILVRPSASNEILACGVSGMYRSADGGATWVKKLDSLFWDMVQDPVNPSTIYAATGWVENSNLGHAAIYKSTDFGNTWSMLNTGIPLQGAVQRIKLAIAPSDVNYIYALCVDDVDGFYGIYQSINAGSTWTYKPPLLNILEHDDGTSPGGQGPYDLALIVDASDKNKIFTGGINIWGSTDGGTNFNPATFWKTQYGPTIHGDIHAIERQPTTGNIFACTDGGIYKTSNLQTGSWGTPWPTTWTNLSGGMQVTSFYRLSSAKNNSGRLCAGSQDNATAYFNSSSWSTIFGGDGMDNYLSPTNNQVILGSSQYGYFYYSFDGGASGNVVGSNPNTENSEWVTPVVADYNHPGVLYIGNENLVKSTDEGQSWTPLAGIYSNTLTMQNTEISALAVSNTNSNVIYAARRVRHELGRKAIVFRTVNGGASFTNITSNLPDTLFYTGIEASPTNSNEAVICMAGFASGHKVYRTTNGGTSWINITGTLPNIPVNCIKYIPGTTQVIIATDLGLYVSNQAFTAWTSFSGGLPNVIISDIEFNPAINKIYISTFGRGIWESSISMIPTGIESEDINKLVEFNVYPTLNNGNFSIETKLPTEKTIDIFDVNGRLVHNSNTNLEFININLKAAPGMYYVRVKSEKVHGVRKIIIQ
jgi:photosystem II stability/assembly factor-like uncharacterized protein